MKKQFIKGISIIVMGTTLLTGCSQSASKEEALQTQLNEQIAINKQLEDENINLKEQIEELKQVNESLQTEEPEKDSEEIKIYSANVDTLAKEEIGSIQVSQDITTNHVTVIETMQAIADIISKDVFDNLPIVIEEIKEVDGKKVAIINLVEDPNSEIKWSNNFFQGSAGGSITEVTLKESFLQKEYNGVWVDGIQVFYEGEAPEFDHVPFLGEVIYR